jgi:hypothetical protein
MQQQKIQPKLNFALDSGVTGGALSAKKNASI